MTLEGQQHQAVNSTNSTMTVYERGELEPVSNDTGTLVAVYAFKFQAPGQPAIPANNILISNCVFRHAYRSINLAAISNCIVRQCQFYPWDASSLFTGEMNNPPTPNTVPRADCNVSIFGGGCNVNILENTCNANSTYTGTNVVNTNNFGWFAPDGFVWLQAGGNFFIARNAITNYMLEAIQLNGGPNAVVGNTEYTLLSVNGCCGVCATGSGWAGLTGLGLSNYSTTYVGNSIYGGWAGEHGGGSVGHTFTINFSGNYLYLFPPFEEVGSMPSAMAAIADCQALNLCGNTLVSGGYGVWYEENCASALILNNDFSGVTYCGIGYMWTENSLPNAQIYGNKLGQGLSFHAKPQPYNGFGWFLKDNQYFNGSANVSPFLDPVASSVHVSN